MPRHLVEWSLSRLGVWSAVLASAACSGPAAPAQSDSQSDAQSDFQLGSSAAPAVSNVSSAREPDAKGDPGVSGNASHPAAAPSDSAAQSAAASRGGSAPVPPSAADDALDTGAVRADAGGAAVDGGGGRDGSAGAVAREDGLRDVLLVGNSVSGSVSVLDGVTHDNLGSVNIIPDLDERMAEINGSPARALAYSAIKQGQVVTHFEPADGDRFVDDVFVSPDGTTLYASRSNLGDVAAFDLTSAGHPLLWHTLVDGSKADHATLSPDGAHLIVSATTADVADVLDAKTGKLIDSFPTGHFPHQNDYSADGRHIYNGSIGSVGSPHAQEASKGLRQLTVVDANSFEVIKTYPFDHGIRPSVITPDEKYMYSQQSYLNGLIKFDLTTGQIVGMLDEPLSEFAMATYKSYDEYPHDSAHHGLAMSGDGSLLCDAGTIDDTVSIVTTADLQVLATLDTGLVPYWATTSADGRFCFVSLSGDNAIAIIDYKEQREVGRTAVGKFPQRNRLGRMRQVDVAHLDPQPG